MSWVDRSIVALMLVVACSLWACRSVPRQKAPEHAVLTVEQRQLNVESFDYVWTTIRDRHWDPTLGGLDWNAVRDELRPKVEQAATQREARAVMTQMIARLGQSHFQILPASVYRDVEAKKSDESSTTSVSAAGGATHSDGSTGIDVRVIDAQAIVTKIDPNLPAAQAGVKPGWRIIEVNGQKIDPRINRVSQRMADSNLLGAYLVGGVKSELAGDIGQTVSVVFRDGRNRKIKKSIPLAPPSGTKANFGNLPTMYVTFESRRLPPNVGYIAFNGFFDPPMVLGRFAQAMHEFHDADGIILDLRGNPGGLGAMALGIGGFFVSQPNQRLGTMELRSTPINFVLNPRAGAYEGPLAILVDELSMSTSEILAGGLQDLKRARIFGTRTPGAALPSVIERLPNGDGFQYAIANYTSVGGEVLEGRGVVPDEPVRLNRAALLSGRDLVIDAAVAWIEQQPKRMSR